jgi:streptogramin lyase
MRTLALLCLLAMSLSAATVTTLVGTGVPGDSATQVNNPYGMAIGPDGALYFCDLGNQRIRRLDLATKQMTTVAGTGQRGYTGDGGPATLATLAAPHELVFDKNGDLYVAERDNHVIRKINMKTGVISTVAGTGKAGFAGDRGPGVEAILNQPHSIFLDRDGTLLICDIGNHRIRRLHLDTGIIEAWAGTGETQPTPDGAPVVGTPVTGPRTFIVSPTGDLYLALREGNAILRIDARTRTYQRVAGTGQLGFTGDGGSARNATFGGSATGNAARLAGPKGLAYGPNDSLYIADTESHAIRRIDLTSGVITTVVGTGQLGPAATSMCADESPLTCALNRPHGVLYANGVLYIADSESHRIRVLTE